MPNYYYSNWNKNRRPSVRKVLASLMAYPTYLWQKFKSEKNVRRKTFQAVLYLTVGLFLVGSITFAWVSLSLPDPNKLNTRIVVQSTKIFARDGTTLLYEIHGEAKRTLIQLSDIPDYMKRATIAIEDQNFYNNPGVDWRGVLRSVFVDIKSVSAQQGGSTITQQFVRAAILTREKTLIRKIKEMVLAIEIGQKYTKDEILQLYLNEIPYGQNAYGIEAAALTYFAKHASNLTLAEAAYLAALPQAPTFYNPNGPNRERLDARKDLVLQQMHEQGYITKEQRDAAAAEKVVFSKVKDAILAPHFVQYVESLLAEKYGEKSLEEGGLKVITTLDWAMQQAAEQAIKDGVARNEKSNKATNAGLVAIDPKTGQILAMVGSRDYFDEEHDGQVNVTLSERQPGSSFKPYVYATAIKQGMSPATMLIDVKTNFGTYGDDQDYIPGNYDGQDHGIVSIRQALAGSLNVPAVKTLHLVGIQNAIDTAKDLGITSDINADRCGLSLVLGGCELRLIDHVSAFGVLANAGKKQDKISILKIEDNQGKILEEYTEHEGVEALDPQVAYQLISIMTDNEARSFIFGSNSPLVLPNRVVAAKTGTTQAWRDGWTIGFTPSLSAGVWAGNNDYTPMRQGADGVVVAAPIWNQFMKTVLKDTSPETFTEPAGMQRVLVDTTSGKLPTEYTPATKSEVFGSNNLPHEFDDVHLAVRINKLNGKQATNQTPPELVETKIFTVIHSELPNNPDWEVAVALWATANGYTYPPTQLDDGSTAPAISLVQTITFTNLVNEQVITTLPLTVEVSPQGFTPATIDMFLENRHLGTKLNAPFTFELKTAKDGWQTLRAVARLSSGNVVQNSIRVNIKSKTP